MSSSAPRPPWSPPSLAELQSLLPGYEFLALIGRGGMGAVFQATQRSLHRPVAIKILPAKLMENAEANFAARFRQEALTMAKLTHPGIVSVFESGEAGGLLYIVMEFVDGTDVARMIQSEGKLAPELASKLLTQVCDALHYAHEHGVIHRDIKPANLLLTRDGTVKIADFGLAKRDDATSLGLTKTNVAIGTPDFLAPEAWTPNTPLDGRADVYALGVTLYQMLTGEVPRGLWKMPSVKAGVDARFDAIIDRAMQPDRAARYQSSAELRRDLEKIQTEPRSAEHRPALGERPTSKPSNARRSRTRWAILVTAACLVALAALLWPRSPKRPLKVKRVPSQSVVVTTVEDDGPGSLRQIVAETTNGATITFAQSLSGGTIVLTNGEIVLAKNLNIDGSTLTNGVTLTGNEASRIFKVSTGEVALIALTLTDGNNSTGGAVYSARGTTLTLRDCTLTANSGGEGGAILNDGVLFLSQCTLTGNSGGYGGGLECRGPTTVSHCTIVENSAHSGGGGIFNKGSVLTLSNSIVARNSPAVAGRDILNQLSRLVYAGANLVPSVFDDRVTAPTTGPEPLTVAPRLAALDHYGGPTPTMPPLPGSPALDAALGSDFAEDQRGFPRPVGAAADLGAVEGVFNPGAKDQARPALVPGPAILATRAIPPAGRTKVVTNNADHGAGSLRDVVASAQSGDFITFTPDLSGQTVLLTSGHIVLNKDLTIDASALPRALQINASRNGRSFLVTNQASVVLDSLVITNGFLERADGAGVLNVGRLTVRNCAIVGNETAWSSGGIFNLNGTVEAANSTFHGNTAHGSGGAIGSYDSKARLVIVHCTISGNQSVVNDPRQGGGGINNSGGTVWVTNSIIAGNSAGSGQGPDVWSQTGTVLAGRCLIGDAATSGISSRKGGNLIDRNALLAPLGDYGGSTPTMPPLPGSPAIDAAIGSDFTMDQRGFLRPVGAAADLGAVESAGLPGPEPGAPLTSAAAARAAAQWMVKNKLKFKVTTGGGLLDIQRERDIPARDFEVVELWFDRWASSLPQPVISEFKVLHPITTVRSIFIQTFPGLADEDFAFLAQNPALATVQIDGSAKLSDGMLKYITGLKRLETLKLAHAPRLVGRSFTNAVWPSLKTAEFYFTALDDIAAEALAGCPKLDRLVVSDTRITDAGLRVLAGARALRVLSVEHAQRLTAGGLAEALPRFSRLQELNAADTPFGDAAAIAISTTLTNLVKLDLRGCPLTDVGLAKLATMPSLRQLDITGTRVTPAGRDAFAAQRPECVLER